MWRAIGCDSWIVVPIGSVCRAGHSLEGTRLTITQSTEVPDGHEFSIRTPVTPPRWDDFDRELTAGFEAICAAALDNGARRALLGTPRLLSNACTGSNARGEGFDTQA